MIKGIIKCPNCKDTKYIKIFEGKQRVWKCYRCGHTEPAKINSEDLKDWGVGGI